MLQYNAPNTTPSSIDGAGSEQFETFHWLKESLIESRKEQYFMPMAEVTKMPKHFGKRIKVHHYIPLLDDRNVNDQGIDAAGATIANGNLYGSSKDIGTITGKIPLLSETGGRVNRVGFTRLQREGTMQKFGFFYEFTQESIDFDSDSELMSHLGRELVTGATKVTEDLLQKDLLAAAGVIVYTGDATSTAEITGEGSAISEVTYDDLMRLSITLDENRTPKQTTVITGSRMVDTKTISNGRVMYVGSEMIPTLRKMKDLHNDPAFIPVHQYAAAGTVLNGEIGTIDAFRIVVVPEMLHWAGVGANATVANEGYRTSGGKYNVYPMLVIGDQSFTTIGFQTDGKSAKFAIKTRMPSDTHDRTDPYGETGFSSIKWWYGILVTRPERIAVVKTVAQM